MTAVAEARAPTRTLRPSRRGPSDEMTVLWYIATMRIKRLAGNGQPGRKRSRRTPLRRRVFHRSFQGRRPLSLTRELAVIHAREGIRVNALSPGPLRTELLMKFLDTEQKRQRRLVHVPMGRFGEAAEMANAALFLASDESSYMTGSNLLVDGGLTAAYVTPE